MAIYIYLYCFFFSLEESLSPYLDILQVQPLENNTRCGNNLRKVTYLLSVTFSAEISAVHLENRKDLLITVTYKNGLNIIINSIMNNFNIVL